MDEKCVGERSLLAKPQELCGEALWCKAFLTLLGLIMHSQHSRRGRPSSPLIDFGSLCFRTILLRWHETTILHHFHPVLLINLSHHHVRAVRSSLRARQVSFLDSLAHHGCKGLLVLVVGESFDGS